MHRASNIGKIFGPKKESVILCKEELHDLYRKYASIVKMVTSRKLDKAEVKLSLCLIKYHAMKTYCGVFLT
jgi:hypothetical protein